MYTFGDPSFSLSGLTMNSSESVIVASYANYNGQKIIVTELSSGKSIFNYTQDPEKFEPYKALDVLVSPNGKYVLYENSNKLKLEMYSVDKKKLIYDLSYYPLFNGPLVDSVYSVDGSLLAWTDNSYESHDDTHIAETYVMNTVTGKLINTFKSASFSLRIIGVTSDNKKIILGRKKVEEGSSFECFDIESGKLLYSIKVGPTSDAPSAQLINNSLLIESGNYVHGIYDATTGVKLKEFRPLGASSRLNSDGSHILSFYGSELQVREVASGLEKLNIKLTDMLANDRIFDVAMDASHENIFVLHWTGKKIALKMIDLKTGLVVKNYNSLCNQFYNRAPIITRNGKYLAMRSCEDLSKIQVLRIYR